MASIRKLPSGKWQATVYHPSGRRITRTDPLKRVVADWARHTEAELARGVWRDPRAGRVIFRTWFERWWKARVVERRTRRDNLSVLHNHVLPQWGEWPLASISRMDVQAWVRKMEQNETGRHAIRKAYTLLVKIMSDATIEGLIAETPCKKIDLPEAPTKRPAWFTREQIAAIQAELPPSHAVMVELMVFTGLRWGEAAGLHGHRVDWLRGKLSVVEEMTPHGVKEYPKSSRSRREVPVPRHIINDMSGLLAGRDREGLVFRTDSKRPGRPLSDSNWRRVWHAAIDAANGKIRQRQGELIPNYPPHTCRHTAASWLAQDGVPLYDVQALLGHESFATTQRYSHLAPDAHDAVLESWNKKLSTHQQRIANKNNRETGG